MKIQNTVQHRTWTVVQACLAADCLSRLRVSPNRKLIVQRLVTLHIKEYTISIAIENTGSCGAALSQNYWYLVTMSFHVLWVESIKENTVLSTVSSVLVLNF